MFFKINAECHIGFKKLTAADLGIGTSHQTHIGLYEGVLNFPVSYTHLTLPTT